MKRLILSILTVLALSLFVLYRTDGFSLSKIHGQLVDGLVEEPTSSTLDLLQQPFTYLAKGRQCFVFVSQDGRHVIKFLNYNRFSLPSWLFSLPLSHDLQLWLAVTKDRRRIRFDATVDSFQLASSRLKEETGIEYLHFQRGANLPYLTIVDRAHRTHVVDLNRVVFIVQKRATPIFEELEARYRVQGQKGLEEGIAQFFSFIQKRCALQIADDDRDVGLNFGFIDGKPILIDPGRIYLDPSLQSQERIQKEQKIAIKRLRKWLKIHHPESVASLDAILSL